MHISEALSFGKLALKKDISFVRYLFQFETIGDCTLVLVHSTRLKLSLSYKSRGTIKIDNHKKSTN